MNKKQAKNLIKEEVYKELKGRNLNEGLIDKIVDYIIGKLIRKKYGKVIDDIKNDPEFIESELSLKRSLEAFDIAAEKADKALKAAAQSRADYKKKYGKNIPLTKGMYIV